MQLIEEFPGAGRLGRHIQHDPRSRRYAYDTSGLSLVPVRHVRNVPVFNQGDLGSCTGNAAVGCVSTAPLFQQLPLHQQLDEGEAVKVYSLATTLDEDPDAYPPIDTGSTGLAAAQALRQLGLIGGFQHTFGLDDMLKAMSLGPVMVGINWYDSFDQPDHDGIVKIARKAEVRGGHEIYADEILMPAGMGGKTFVGFTNSWGDSWGVSGRFYLSVADVERLLHEQGDVTIPVPGTAPTPIPDPVTPTPPTPDPQPAAGPDDVALWADMQKWAKLKGLS